MNELMYFFVFNSSQKGGMDAADKALKTGNKKNKINNN